MLFLPINKAKKALLPENYVKFIQKSALCVEIRYICKKQKAFNLKK